MRPILSRPCPTPRAKKLKHPKELLKKDQEVDAIVTNIDAAGQRLSLSMKDLTPSAWEGFVATHRPGDVVRGKVSRFTSFGVFVELGEGLEGLCHISELSDERVENAESVVKLGQELDFKILRIENDDQKIGLSYRAVGKEDEPIVDTRIYSTEAKGGMASLGELANLIKGPAAEEGPAAEVSKEEKEEARKEKKAKAKQEYEEAAAREAEAAERAAAEAANTPEASDETAAEVADEAPAESSEIAPEVETATAPETAEEAPAKVTVESEPESTETVSEAEAEEVKGETFEAVVTDSETEPVETAKADSEAEVSEEKSA